MIRVFVPGQHMMGWGGGVEFLKFYLGVLDKIEGIEVEVGIPVERPDQRFVRLAKNCIKMLLGRSPHKPLNYERFWANYQHIKPIYHRQWASPKETKDADIVLLTMIPAEGIERKRVIGYISDLQHIHLPHFFSQGEIDQRNKSNKEMMEHCGTIFVNSRHTQADLNSNYAEQASQCDFYSMAFLPLAKELDTLGGSDLALYNLPKLYFIISNQLWIHKDHPTALRAMGELLKDERYGDVELICTGGTHDYRQPNYFSEIQASIKDLGIEKNVRFLGFIPKNDQINILRGAVAVVQPTLFEGGPGGGAAYEAVAYGVPAILSDIEINREIENPRVAFFKAGDSHELCVKMKERLDNPMISLPLDVLRAQSERNYKQACIDIENLIKNVANK